MTDPSVQSARTAVMSEGPVPAILDGQTARGYWAVDRTYYTPKYLSTHWALLLLTELAVEGTDRRFQRGVDFMLDATALDYNDRLGLDKHGWSCFYGNIVRYAVHAGFLHDPRLERVIDHAQRDLLNGPCRCEWHGGLACAWGTARTLWGLAALPPDHRPPALQAAMDDAVAFLTAPGALVDAAYPVPAGGGVHALWTKLSFPLFYQADILFTLRALADLDALGEPGAQEGVAWLADKQLKNGRWRGTSPYRSRTWPLGPPAETSRWVTLQAAELLRDRG